ncbi:ependymin-related protein 1-like [Saccoglossus kowalevskii]|uniref:Ependymin-related protein 1-like n=1 Tax=Saccoglossus kowalevskii TaxID=10224 RepID=A0ABM0GLS4_SACKO|nr:PREDICTED: ependymin-related protein 1-like [Saccoglossus kowalevskii]
MKLLVFLSFVACTVAFKCCPPKQFEGFIGSYGGSCSHQGQAGLLFSWGQVHYDYKKAMVAVEETVYVDKQQEHVQVIQDYANEVMYLIIGGNCTKSDLPDTEIMCVPDSAVYVMTQEYGMGAMTVDIYSYGSKLFGDAFFGQISVTRDKCIPMGVNLGINHPQASIVMSFGYANLTLGIKDPSVFDIPEICHHNDVIPFKVMGEKLSDRMKVVMSSYSAR